MQETELWDGRVIAHIQKILILCLVFAHVGIEFWWDSPLLWKQLITYWFSSWISFSYVPFCLHSQNDSRNMMSTRTIRAITDFDEDSDWALKETRWNLENYMARDSWIHCKYKAFCSKFCWKSHWFARPTTHESVVQILFPRQNDHLVRSKNDS